MKKEKGFTLIELLAVIVILAVLLVIAVPAVSSYITSSKKGSFISSAKLFLNQARNKVLTEKTFPREAKEKVVIPIAELDMEKDMETSSYGNDWVKSKSYVVIENVGTSVKPIYSYSIALEDNKGYCINLILEDDLDSSVVNKSKCNIELFSEIAVSKIEKLLLTNMNEFQVDVDGNSHYYGATPNNYATFNGETAGWRILGLYTVDGEKRLKLVRDNPIGKYSWDNKNIATGASTNYGSHDWTTARLMKLLNPGYEDEEVGGSLYWNSGSGYCYAGQNNATVPCDFKNIGLTDDAQKMIKKSTFNIGGHSTSDMSASGMIEKERTKTGEGYVGLMTASDYGYASNLNVCTKKLYYYSSDTVNCTGTNYLFGNYWEWLLTYRTTSVYNSFYRGTVGRVYYGHDDNRVFGTGAIRPVVYLDSSVRIIYGSDGTAENPFELIL